MNNDLEFELRTNPYKQYSTRVIGIFVLPFILFFAMFTFQNGIFIIYIIPTIILVFKAHDVVYSQKFEVSSLKIIRTISRNRVIEGDEFLINFEIINESNYNSQQIELIDILPASFKVKTGVNKFLFQLDANHSVELSYGVSCDHYGLYELNSVTLIHKDFLGMNSQVITFTAKKLINKEIFQPITIVPRLEKIETLPVLPQWLKFYNGNFTSNQIGFDSDFRSIRNYQYGDTLRRINWKTTAKHGGIQLGSNSNLFTNNYSVDKSLEAEIIFDLTFSAGPIWIDSIRQVTSITEFLIRYRNKVGLTVLNQFPDYFKPKVGKRQLKSIVDKVLSLEADTVKNDDILLDRLFNIANKYDRNAVIIIISPFLNEYVFKFIKLLKSRHMKILAITPLALYNQITRIRESKLNSFALENPIVDNLSHITLSLKEKEIETRLKKHRIFQIKWITSQPIDKTFRNIKITY